MVMDGIEPQKKEFLNNVGKTFTTADAIQAGKEVGLSERSVMYALVGLASDNNNQRSKTRRIRETAIVVFALHLAVIAVCSSSFMFH